MGGLTVAKCGKRTFSFSSSTVVTTLQCRMWGAGGLGPETSWICWSVVKKPRDFLQQINLGLRGAGMGVKVMGRKGAQDSEHNERQQKKRHTGKPLGNGLMGSIFLGPLHVVHCWPSPPKMITLDWPLGIPEPNFQAGGSSDLPSLGWVALGCGGEGGWRVGLGGFGVWVVLEQKLVSPCTHMRRRRPRWS